MGPPGGCGQCGLCVARSRKTEWETGDGGARSSGKSLLESDCSPRSCSPRPFPGLGQQLFLSSPPPARVPGRPPPHPHPPRGLQSEGVWPVGGWSPLDFGEGSGAFPFYLNLFGTGGASPQSPGRKGRGRGHCAGKVPLGERVRLSQGRVKGPLPDGLLTLWCPATGNDHLGFPFPSPPPTHTPPYSLLNPGVAERKTLQLSPGLRARFRENGN